MSRKDKGDRSASSDRPTHKVTYRDEDGKPVTRQTYSAVQAELIKEEHPDAKITPTGQQ